MSSHEQLWTGGPQLRNFYLTLKYVMVNKQLFFHELE